MMQSAKRFFASTADTEVKGKMKTGNKDAAKLVGDLVASKMQRKRNRQPLCFDRGGYVYHGRIKALADAARAAGLKF